MHQPHLLPLADRIIEPTTPEILAGHDVGVPRPAARPVRTRSPPSSAPDSLVIDCGADHRLTDPVAWATVLRRRPSRVVAVRHAGTAGRAGRAASAPSGSPCPAATRRRRRWPWRRHWPPDWSNPTSWWSPRPVPPAPASRRRSTCSAREVMGSASAYGVGGVHRHTPEMVQNLSAAAGAPVTVSFTPVLVPMSRGILATVSAPVSAGVTARRRPRCLREGLWRRAFRPSAAGRPVADDGRDARREHRAAAGRPRRGRRPGGRHRRAGQPDQGHRRRRRAVPEPRRSACRRRPACRPWESRRDSTDRRRQRTAAAQGFRAAGVTAGLKSSGQPDVAARRQRRTPVRRAAGVFTSNRVKAAPVRWCEKHSGPARGGTGRGGAEFRRRQRLHRTPTATPTPSPPQNISPTLLAVAGAADRGRLHRADRAAAADGQAAARRRRRGRRAGRQPADSTRPTAIMTTDSVPKTAAGQRSAGSPSAGWPRAPACSPRAWPPCWWC